MGSELDESGVIANAEVACKKLLYVQKFIFECFGGFQNGGFDRELDLFLEPLTVGITIVSP